MDGNMLIFSRLTQNGTLTLNGTEDISTGATTVNANFTIGAGKTWTISSLTLNLHFTTDADIDWTSGGSVSLSGTGGSLTVNGSIILGSPNTTTFNL